MQCYGEWANACGIAGPVNIHERVMRAMTRPSQNHRDPWFNPWFCSILEEVKTIFKTKEATTFIFPGTGTGEEVFLCLPRPVEAAAYGSAPSIDTRNQWSGLIVR